VSRSEKVAYQIALEALGPNYEHVLCALAFGAGLNVSEPRDAQICQMFEFVLAAEGHERAVRSFITFLGSVGFISSRRTH
jgi:hypothetical protein